MRRDCNRFVTRFCVLRGPARRTDDSKHALPSLPLLTNRVSPARTTCKSRLFCFVRRDCNRFVTRFCVLRGPARRTDDSKHALPSLPLLTNRVSPARTTCFCRLFCFVRRDCNRSVTRFCVLRDSARRTDDSKHALPSLPLLTNRVSPARTTCFCRLFCFVRRDCNRSVTRFFFVK